MHSSYIKDRIKSYEDNKKLIDSGNFKYIPFYNFDRLQKHVPGIVPGLLYKITSHMGVGKTQLAKFLFVYQTMLFAIKNNINFKIIYFALEESREEFLDSLFIHLTRRINKIHINRYALTGFSATSLTKSELDEVKKVEKAMINLTNNIEIVDNLYKPTDIFNKCKEYAKKWGTFIQNTGGEDIKYIPNDPNQIVLVVTDHISLLEPEFNPETKKYLDSFNTIAKWHTHYARRKIAKEWNWAVLNVQQQTLDSAKEQYNYKGTSIIDKVIPSLEGLANNKEVGRDDYVNIALFSPAMYNIDKFRGYDIMNNTATSFEDRFRTIHLIKNRFGSVNKVLPLYFDGRYTYFKELPLPTDSGMAYFYKLLKT